MTAPSMADLGRRAIACRAWRWLPGMLTVGGLRIDGTDRRGEPYRGGSYRDDYGEQHETRTYGNDLAIPDLADPATLGCLLALVREAWGDPLLCATVELGSGWIMAVSLCSSMLSGGRYFRGPTEAAALVAALEAAPVRS